MNKPKLTVMFDYDDVLFPLIPPWVHTLNRNHKINVSPDDITDWDITKFFPTLTREQVFAPLLAEDFWHNSQPIENGVETLREIKDQGHTIKVVTSSFYQNVKPKAERLFEVYPFIKWDDVIVTSNKQMIIGDILVDDKPENLLGGNYFPVLMSASHNQAFDHTKQLMSRIEKIEQVHNVINGVQIASVACETGLYQRD